MDAVAAGLLAELRTHLRVDALAEPGPEALERAEGSLDRVLLVAGADDPTRDFCLRQADHVVLVAAADAEVPAAAHLDPEGADLVLVGARPEEDVVAAWCHALEPWQVTIAADGVPREDLRMLAARIGGWSVGIVLAGGGARGFAHIGVLQELAAAGIAVDRVAGSSIGAIVAGAYASGMDPETMHEVFYGEFVRRNPIGDYTAPTVSLIKGRRTPAPAAQPPRGPGDPGAPAAVPVHERRPARPRAVEHRRAAISRRPSAPRSRSRSCSPRCAWRTGCSSTAASWTTCRCAC